MVEEADLFFRNNYNTILDIVPDVLKKHASYVVFDRGWGKKNIEGLLLEFLEDLSHDIYNMIDEIVFFTFLNKLFLV